ncbi:MAG: PaaI family thioesterase [Anaerolineales bacterium]
MPEPPQPIDASRAQRKQPNSRMCFACGLQNPVGLQLTFYDDGAGRVVAEAVVAPHYQGYPGRTHGGVVAAMLDEIVGRTAMTEDPNRFMATAKLDVRYRQPIPLGEKLRLQGSLTRRKGRIAWAHAEVRLADGSVGAEAEATLVDVEPIVGDPAALGWRVYPDSTGEGEQA